MPTGATIPLDDFFKLCETYRLITTNAKKKWGLDIIDTVIENFMRLNSIDFHFVDFYDGSTNSNSLLSLWLEQNSKTQNRTFIDLIKFKYATEIIRGSCIQKYDLFEQVLYLLQCFLKKHDSKNGQDQQIRNYIPIFQFLLNVKSFSGWIFLQIHTSEFDFHYISVICDGKLNAKVKCNAEQQYYFNIKCSEIMFLFEDYKGILYRFLFLYPGLESQNYYRKMFHLIPFDNVELSITIMLNSPIYLNDTANEKLLHYDKEDRDFKAFKSDKNRYNFLSELQQDQFSGKGPAENLRQSKSPIENINSNDKIKKLNINPQSLVKKRPDHSNFIQESNPIISSSQKEAFSAM